MNNRVGCCCCDSVLSSGSSFVGGSCPSASEDRLPGPSWDAGRALRSSRRRLAPKRGAVRTGRGEDERVLGGEDDMRKLTRVHAAVGVSLAILLATAVAGVGVPFQEAPPTSGIHRPTAYTLRGGEWQIGGEMGFRLFPQEYVTSSVTVAYGLAPWFQMGVSLGHSIAAVPGVLTYAASAKFRVPLGEGFDLGVPFGVGFQDRGFGTEFGYLQGGVVVSMRLGEFTLHGGTTLGLRKEQGSYLQPYVVADFDLLPNLKLVGELGLIPVSVAAGAWLRLAAVVDVKLSFLPMAASVRAGVYLRF